MSSLITQGLSIRYKLLIVLVATPLISLTIFLFFAIDLFGADKIAYLFDTNMTASRSVANQLNIFLTQIADDISKFATDCDLQINDFGATTKQSFLTNENYNWLAIYALDSNSVPQKKCSLTKNNSDNVIFTQHSDILHQILTQSKEKKISLAVIANDTQNVLFATRFINTVTNTSWIVAINRNGGLLFDEFRRPDTYLRFLITADGKILLSPKDQENRNQLIQEMLGTNNKYIIGDSTAEFSDKSGTTYLISFAKVQNADFLVSSLINKEETLEVIKVFFVKSVALTVALISLIVLISFWISRKYSMNLIDLMTATNKVAKGNFDITLKASSNDEVGALTKNFNVMAKEVRRLMRETEDRLRMKNELQIAHAVQESLLPAKYANIGPLEIAGFYQPASEIGGDWWHYSQIDNRIFLWIADASGHGVPAALLTSAIKSASTFIENYPNINLSEAMKSINLAICETAKAKYMMTLFLGVIDIDSQTLHYCNASHDPPYLIHRQKQKINKNDLLVLNESYNPRVGEDKNSNFQESQLSINHDDLLIFYTDGVTDIHNDEGEPWKERRFLKSLFAAIESGYDVERIVNKVTSDALLFSNGAPLDDDFTFYIAHYQNIANTNNR